MSEVSVPPAEEATKSERNPWLWIPSLYFAEGIPNVIVVTVSVVMFKNMGVSNTLIGLYTSWLYLPWVIKPIWSPLVDLMKTKRWWIVAMQLLIGAGLGGVALSLPGDNFVRYSMLFLWLLAFSSATHDIAADGFYMLGLSEHQQTWFVGIRSTFYRLAMITGQGLLVILAGRLEKLFTEPSTELLTFHISALGGGQSLSSLYFWFAQHHEGVAAAWSITLGVAAALFILIAFWHWLTLPKPKGDELRSSTTLSQLYAGTLDTFGSFFRKKEIVSILAFLLLYRLAEAQLAKMASPFLLDKRSLGGLGLETDKVGIVYGTVGVTLLTLGGILGGVVAANQGLKHWLWTMALAINLPNVVYVVLAYTQPENLLLVNLAVAIEQFGYGFGFTAYMLFTLYIAKGEHETAHYAIGTGFMALGMMLPGMVSGWLQTKLGYQHFFLWVMLCTIPSFAVCKLVKIDPNFGRREAAPGGE
ncbi:MAG: hypothetical protein RH917_04885 [Lacipirellulaceae bacterium]